MYEVIIEFLKLIAIVVGGSLLVGIIMLVIFHTLGFISSLITIGLKKRAESSQSIISDKDLLLLIAAERDALISVDRLVARTGMTKKQAKVRLSYFHKQNFLAGYTKDSFLKDNTPKYFALREEIDDRPLQLSSKPFLTVEDVLKLFKHHNYRLTTQRICITTGLPAFVIQEELKYFKKEKMIKELKGNSKEVIYVLEDQYLNNPDQFLEKEDQLDLALAKIYEKETKQP